MKFESLRIPLKTFVWCNSCLQYDDLYNKHISKIVEYLCVYGLLCKGNMVNGAR